MYKMRGSRRQLKIILSRLVPGTSCLRWRGGPENQPTHFCTSVSPESGKSEEFRNSFFNSSKIRGGYNYGFDNLIQAETFFTHPRLK